jgi:ABC-type multidrug transport system permease subunit
MGKDVRRILKDPLGLLIWLFIPLMVGVLMQLAFGGQQTTPSARLLVADEDESLLSGLLLGALGQDQLGEMMDAEAVEREDGERVVERGRATALLVIPEGFGEAYLAGEPDTLYLLTNPAQTILPGIVQEVLEVLTTGGSLLREFLGGPIDQIVEMDVEAPGTAEDLAVADIAVQVNQLISGADQFLFPPAIAYQRIDPDTTGEESDDPFSAALGGSLLGLFFPGLITMLLLFAGSSLTEDVWAERRGGTVRRALSVPVHIRWFLMGKHLAGSLVLGCVLLLGMLIGRFGLDIPMRWWLAGTLFYAVAGWAWVAGLTAVQVATTRERGASILINVVVMVLLLAGGSFFPIEVMPAFMQPFARLTPNGWAITRFKELSSGAITPVELIPVMLALVAIGLVAWWFSAWRVAGPWGRGGD